MKLNRLIVVSLSLASLATIQAIAANDWYVDCDHGSDSNQGQSWTDPYKSIQKAINNAADDDTINVIGYCYENLDINGRSLNFNGTKGTAVTEGTWTFYPGATIDGGTNGPVINTNGTESGYHLSTFWYFYIVNGQGLQNSEVTANTAGGGVYVAKGHDFHMYSCVIKENQAKYGAGVFIDAESTAGFQDCWITDNTESQITQYGPGLYTNNFNANNTALNHCLICANGQPGIVQYTCSNGSSCDSQFVVSNGTYPPIHNADKSQCPSHFDANNDGVIDIEDVRWVQNIAGICYHDTNGSGETDIDDLLLVIEGWGDSCTP